MNQIIFIQIHELFPEKLTNLYKTDKFNMMMTQDGNIKGILNNLIWIWEGKLYDSPVNS